MKVFFLLASIAAITVADPVKWQSFKLGHNKTYQSIIEERLRYKIFQDNLKQIEEHNAKYEQGLVSFKKRINQFGDMTGAEFLAFLKLSGAAEKAPATEVHKSVNETPTEVDWRDFDAVTSIKNQGSCGSCWAFSATGSLEGQQKLIQGTLVSLSDQNLLDCAGSAYGNNGCNGGLMDRAFQYVIDYGINSEDEYPYEAVQKSCRFDSNSVVLRATAYIDIEQNNEDNLINAIGTVGPVSVAIDATNELQFYSSGLFGDSTCSKTTLNHGVLAVGYGSNYITVKNSWGKSWGESGYVRFLRGENMCGIAALASYPVL